MNERFKLPPQEWLGYDPEKGDIHGYTFEQMREFGELIVRECVRVARATPAPNFHEHLKQQLGHTWDMAVVEAGREIAKHFGVE